MLICIFEWYVEYWYFNLRKDFQISWRLPQYFLNLSLEHIDNIIEIQVKSNYLWLTQKLQNKSLNLHNYSCTNLCAIETIFISLNRKENKHSSIELNFDNILMPPCKIIAALVGIYCKLSLALGDWQYHNIIISSKYWPRSWYLLLFCLCANNRPAF